MNPRAAAFGIAGALVIGCASAPPAPPVAVDLNVPPAASSAPAQPVQPPAPPASPPVAQLDPPPDVLCTLKGQGWNATSGDEASGPSGAPLRFHAGGAPFATVQRLADATLALPGAGTTAMLSGNSAGVEIRGIVDAADVPVFMASAVLVGGDVIPAMGTALAWSGHAPDGVELTIPTDNRVTFVSPVSTFRAPCSGVGLVPASFDPLAALPGAAGASKRAELRRGKKIAFLADANGPKVADVQLGSDDFDNEITLLGARGGKSRVAWWMNSDAVLVGWVSRADVQPPTGRLLGMLSATGGDAEPKTTPTRCARTIPLFAKVGAERRAVGRVGSGAEMHVVARGGDDVAVAFPQLGFLPVAPASLYVTGADLDGCATE